MLKKCRIKRNAAALAAKIIIERGSCSFTDNSEAIKKYNKVYGI